MRAGIGIVLVGTWALVAAAIGGQEASLSQVSLVFIGGLLVAGWLGFVVSLSAKAREVDDLDQPHQVADRLGSLTHGQVFTDTAQRRAECKRRLTLSSQARGPARITRVQ